MLLILHLIMYAAHLKGLGVDVKVPPRRDGL